MDAYNPYLLPRPPPPPPPSSTADLQFQYQYPPPRPPAPPPPQSSWNHSNQFQYQTSPSTPPPPQWAPPPPAYPPPPPHPYPHTYLNHQYPPPPPPPPPLPPTQYPNSYPQQEWSNPNWAYQQSWNHPDSEDWAARAKAWADAKAAIDNQHPQSQYNAPTGRLEEQNHYQNQYPQTVDTHYAESHEQLHSGPGFQEHALSSAPPNGQPSTINGSGSSSYLPDGHVPYSGRDGALTAEQKATFSQQESLPSNQSIHQQEVPSSYSSVSGQSMVSHLPVSAAQDGVHVQPPIPAAAGSVPADQTFAYGSHLSEPMTDLANQPLQFTPRFSRDQDSLIPAGYAHNIDPVGSTASVNTWSSAMVPDATYSSIPPSLTQSDPSMSVASHLPGHPTASFPRFPVASFQSTIPSPSASFGVGAGAGLPPSTAFAGDGYGVSNISERPKKAPVPNWLREEIIKKKASIASTSLGHAKDEEQSLEDEGVDRFQKNDPGDSKSHESSRSTEDNEDDDEDYVEAARTAAINQEIKRVLTEVLLKVTDELFDEIATKVLDEDDMASDDDHDVASAGSKVVPSMGAATTSKAPVRVHLPAAAKELDTGHSEKSSSSSEGNVLGLVNYASDDDKDVGDEVTTSNLQSSTRGGTPTSSVDGRFLNAGNDAHQNGKFGAKFEEHVKNQADLETGSDRAPSIQNGSVRGGDSINNENDELEPAQSSKEAGGDAMNFNGPAVLDGAHASVSVGLRKPMSPDAEGKESKVKSSGTGKDESRRFSSGQASSKEPERAKTKGDEKLDDKIRRKEEKHQRKEKTERHDSKDKKEQGKSGERVKEFQSKKRSGNHEIREDRKESERSHKASSKGDYSRGSERKSRSGRENDSSRHKRRRSSSTDSRGRNGKDDKNSSDEASNDSRRKSHTRKRNLSPSPVRSRRRQVSRSPHSKRSQRKHSPYSSHESTRGRRRSRSRSPVRRQR